MKNLLVGVFIFAPFLAILVLVSRFAFGDSWRAAFGAVGFAAASTALFVLWVYGIVYLAGG